MYLYAYMHASICDVCMCTCMWTCPPDPLSGIVLNYGYVCMGTCVYMYIHASTCMCMYMFVYINVYVYVSSTHANAPCHTYQMLET